ncbi:MAG TPA: DUF3179 domain-containing protein [Chloroflexi bacterium]|nr:DUF3179 domain-containing protein [Chloroflexota bacterium]
MKRQLVWFAFLFLLAGCGRLADGAAEERGTAVSPPTPTVSPRATPTRSQFANAASRECANPVPEDRQFPLPPWPNTNFCRHSAPYDEFIWGGRSRDGIPALNNPELETIAEAELWLTDPEPALVLQLGGEARAYPIPILIWHEIVNDVVAGQPVVVTYCPLCNSGLAFERTLDGQTLEFGVTGILRNADLIMFDRLTESWWQQFTGEAVVGEMTGTKLTPLPVSMVSFADFKAQFPNGRLLSIYTGYDRRYGENPYLNYDSRFSRGTKFYKGELDDRLVPKMRVMTVAVGDTAVAYPYDILSETGAINDEVAGQPLVVFWKSGTNTPLYNKYIAEARDAGSAAVYSRELDGQTLTFTAVDDGFTDEETGSGWNIFGTAVSGPLAGAQLTSLNGNEFFWFAWAAFRPDTSVYGATDGAD